MYQEPKLLRIKEVAELLDVNVRTVYRRIWDGKLPASKIGGLYYVRESDLKALLESSREKQEHTNVGKCDSCLRILRNASEVSGYCQSEGCQKMICKDCFANGRRTCRDHHFVENEKPLKASAGKEKMQLSSTEARVRELAFIEKVVARISQVDSLMDPESGQIISVTNWSNYLIEGDSRAELLQILGKAYLEAREVANLPLNAWSKFRLSDFQRQVKRPILIEIQVLSRLGRMFKERQDSEALESSDLAKALYRFQVEAKEDPGYRFIVLAATTGWAKNTIRLINKEDQGGSLLPPNALLYLFDLEKNELIYNKKDPVACQYAGLFIPISIQEEAQNAIEVIERIMASRGHTSLTLDDAATISGYSRLVLEETFQLMSRTGMYRQFTLEDLGKVIQRTV